MSISPQQLAASGTEHGHQAAIFCWRNQNLDKYPQLKRMFAIPNGGQRNAATAGRLKAEGVQSGVSDIFLPVSIKPYNGLFLELKVGRNTPSDEQDDFMADMTTLGYRAVWCTGWEAAVKIIVEYLEGRT